MIIAEIGLNHLGKKSLLDLYIKKAKKVDGLTIQILSDSFYLKNKKFSDFKLSEPLINKFIEQSYNEGFKVGLVIDDHNLIDKYHSKYISFYKILSKDIGDLNLFKKISNTSVDEIYISTGLSSFEDLDKIVPYVKSLDNRIKLIHTQLSNDVKDVNLKAIEVMNKRYNLPISYGHHCLNEKVIYASLGFEPYSIFIYIKGPKTYKYPDDLHAISLEKIDDFVNNVSNLRECIGSGNKIAMSNKL